jgi:uncharacterized protein YjhX (UPF0386 family)
MVTGMFIALMVIAVGLSFLLYKFPNYLLSIISGGAWIVLIPYMVANTISGLVVGSTAHQILMFVFGGMGVAMLIIGIMRTINKSRERAAEIEYYTQNGGKVAPKNYEAFQEAKERQVIDNEETEEQYRMRVRGVIQKAKNRARGR